MFNKGYPVFKIVNVNIPSNQKLTQSQMAKILDDAERDGRIEELPMKSDAAFHRAMTLMNMMEEYKAMEGDITEEMHGWMMAALRKISKEEWDDALDLIKKLLHACVFQMSDAPTDYVHH